MVQPPRGFTALPYAERERLYLAYKAGLDMSEGARRVGTKVESFTRKLRKFGETSVPKSAKERFDAPPAIEGDALILADPHCPYHDAAFINQTVTIAVKWGVPNCIVAGDILDYNAFSPFDPNMTDTLEQEFTAGEALLGALAHAFTKVLCLTGNHDARLYKKIGYHQIAPERVGKMLSSAENVEFSPYYFCLLGDNYLVEHPKNVSVLGGKVASSLAAKYHKNVISTHGHLFGMSQDVSGEYVGIDSGCCADPRRLEYISLRHNTRPEVVQGAVILRGGYPWLLNKFSDWGALERLGKAA